MVSLVDATSKIIGTFLLKKISDSYDYLYFFLPFSNTICLLKVQSDRRKMDFFLVKNQFKEGLSDIFWKNIFLEEPSKDTMSAATVMSKQISI